mgnify:CR=1 FL=1
MSRGLGDVYKRQMLRELAFFRLISLKRIRASQRFAIPLRYLRLALLPVAISPKVSLAAMIRYALFVMVQLSTRAISVVSVDSRMTLRLLHVATNAVLVSRVTRTSRLVTPLKASVPLKSKGPNSYETRFFQPQGE